MTARKTADYHKEFDKASCHCTLLAKAVYDNIAETPDELAFRRGDVLTIIEQDTKGLEGWWLCSLRGKQGIVPGNRLKLLSGMHDGNHGNENIYKSPASEKEWNRRSWDVTSSSKVVTPSRHGEIYIYEEIPRTAQDYDVPPSRHLRNNSFDHTPTKMDHQGNYDTPSRSQNESGWDMSDLSEYDTPPSSKMHQNSSHNGSQFNSSVVGDDVYDVPISHSNRSSILSNISHLSNESTMTVSTSSISNKSHGKSSNPPSNCDSARSSMDISPHDFYDVPPSQSLVLHHHKQPSADSGLDLYDSPPKGKLVLDSLSDYDVPKSESTPVSKSKSMDMFKTIKETENAYDIPSSGGAEFDLDDVYDVPKNNTLVRKQAKSLINELNASSKSDQSDDVNSDVCGVYDIPPQVTRDSMLSAKSDSSDSVDGQRTSACSVDSRDSDIPIYDELPLDLDAAMDLMVKLQQDCQRSTAKLSSYVSSTWRIQENLEPKLYGIKIACNGMKNSLEEFLDFAQGTLANSAKLPDRKLIHKLHRQLNPLQQTLLQIKICLKNLDENNWQMSRLVTNDSAKLDDLGKISSVAKDLAGDIRKLVSLIHGNSSLLFKRAKDGNLLKSEGKSTPDMGSPFSKPPMRPKPTLPQKPMMTPEKICNVQQRPLPMPPGSKERPLPPTPTESKSMSFSDIKRLSGEFRQDVSIENKSLLSDIKDLSLDSTEDGKTYENNKEEDIADEYDYVHLETKDIEEQSRVMKEEQEKKKRMAIHEDLDKQPVKESSLRELSPLKSLTDIQNTLNAMNSEVLDSEMEETVKTPVNRNFVMDSEHGIPPMIKLDANDKQVLVYYSGQLDTHSTLLTNAIDAFFSCIECGQGPKIFISHSKFVVVSAHKLVYIGDSLHRNLIHNEVKNKIMHCANHLCNCLKLTVTATKTAALQFPSVPVVQEMVDRVVDVSHAAYELKTVIGQASAL